MECKARGYKGAMCCGSKRGMARQTTRLIHSFVPKRSHARSTKNVKFFSTPTFFAYCRRSFTATRYSECVFAFMASLSSLRILM